VGGGWHGEDHGGNGVGGAIMEAGEWES
jgi:hypothetical protein